MEIKIQIINHLNINFMMLHPSVKTLCTLAEMQMSQNIKPNLELYLNHSLLNFRFCLEDFAIWTESDV